MFMIQLFGFMVFTTVTSVQTKSEDFNRWVPDPRDSGQKYKKNDAESRNRVWSGPMGPETC